MITRALGLVPSMAVAIAVGRSGVDTLLVASQVALSIVLPFIVFPLLYLTANKEIMSVKKPIASYSASSKGQDDGPGELLMTGNATIEDVEASVEIVSYANGRITQILGWLLWLVIVAANAYAIITLALGED